MNKGSKFAGVFQTTEPEPKPTSPKPSKSPQGKRDAPSPPAPRQNPPKALSDAPEPSETPVRRGPGRPRGKRTSPDFAQTTVHLRKDTLKRVRIAFAQEDKKPEFSELVEQLLGKWLNTQGY